MDTIQTISKNFFSNIQKELNQKSYPAIKEVFGGDINKTFKLDFNGNIFFIKVNKKDNLIVFQDEFLALEKISNTNTIKTPKPYLYGVYESLSYLIMQYLDLSNANAIANKDLGIKLAKMHNIKYDFFGYFDSKMDNNKEKNWNTFFAKNRLEDKIKTAKTKNASTSLINKTYKLIENIDKFLTHNPTPSLLHGDLWGGNFSSIKNEAVIYDPSSYYGDREVDLAMSELFGGFSNEFYKFYNETNKIEDGYELRKIIYNIDPVINHFNLFGGHYSNQAENMLDKILNNLH